MGETCSCIMNEINVSSADLSRPGTEQNRPMTITNKTQIKGDNSMMMNSNRGTGMGTSQDFQYSNRK
ncbi:MAG: hypothetical protein MJ252_23675 [archaeon]|nr:hypothetical protein [archaeon]